MKLAVLVEVASSEENEIECASTKVISDANLEEVDASLLRAMLAEIDELRSELECILRSGLSKANDFRIYYK